MNEIRGVILAIITSLFFFLGFSVYRLYQGQKNLLEVMKSNQSLEAISDQSSKDQNETICSTEKLSWAQIQPKIKDTVVQVFSQVAEFNWLEPYKTPNQLGGSGSGFFINDKGYLITNFHVINQARVISIQIPSMGKELVDVEVVGVDPVRDIALLKIQDSEIETVKKELGKIPFLTFGNSDSVRRTDEVVALGYPLGMMSLKSTKGVVSGRESVMRRQFIQIDAAINPGNSGGPVLDKLGQVIGISTAGIPSAQNVGYIIPINELKLILKDIQNPPVDKVLRKPFMGVFINPGSAKIITKFLNNPEPGGSYLTDVFKDSILDKAGVQAGDMIYEINENTVDAYGEVYIEGCEDKMSLVEYISLIPLGSKIKLVVYRNGKRKEFNFNFTQSKLPEIRVMYPDYEKIDYTVIGGIVVMQLSLNHLPLLITHSPDLIIYEEIKNQIEPVLVISHVLPDSQAYRSRSIAPGKRIKKINDIEVKTLQDFKKAINKSSLTNFLIIKTFDDVLTVLPFEKVLQDEIKLSQVYKYPLSQEVQALIKKQLEKNGKKETGSIA